MEKSIKECLKEKILILDGGMGTLIQRHNLSEKDYRNAALQNHPFPLMGNHDVLSITQPEIIKNIHSAYLEAGADIVETNTFSSTAIAQEDYQLEKWVYELNLESAKIAKEVAHQFTTKNTKKPRFVAGAIGPTNKTASFSPDVNDPSYRAITFEALKDAYTTQICGLLDGGVDILLVETIFDTLNAKAALFAIEEEKEKRKRDIPVMISGTITDASGRTLSGQTVEAFYISLSHIDMLSIGLNCALGAETLFPYLKALKNISPHYISAHPNAGLPNEFGEYDETPTEMAKQIRRYLDEGVVQIIGGCCGTTPEHIAAIHDLVLEFQEQKVIY